MTVLRSVRKKETNSNNTNSISIQIGVDGWTRSFDDPSDEEARNTLQALYTDRKVGMVPMKGVLKDGGMMHYNSNHLLHDCFT